VGEAEAWASVLAAWDDEEAHRSYLARFPDMEGLTRAGGRYRAVLDERPGDTVALSFRDEVVKRATAVALASLPRTPGRRETPRSVRVVVGAAALVFGGVAVWAVLRLFSMLLGARS
jgi:hypothetical protein